MQEIDLQDGEVVLAIIALVIGILVVVPQLIAIYQSSKDKED